MKVFELYPEEYQEMREESGGFCVHCRCEAYGIEPDARRYTCDTCDRPTVYGIEEMLIRGWVEVLEQEPIPDDHDIDPYDHNGV